MKSKSAFSLIELLIVMAIIGIIAAIAIPAYQQYTVRAKLGKAIGILKTLTTAASQDYLKGGTFPNQMRYNNAIYGGGPGWAYVHIPLGNGSEIVSLNYSRSPYGKGFIVQATTTATSTIDGYAQPGVGGAYGVGTYAQIVYSVRDIDSVITSFCGDFRAFNSTESIPVAYLPSGCRCQNGLTWYANGNAPCVQG